MDDVTGDTASGLNPLAYTCLYTNTLLPSIVARVDLSAVVARAPAPTPKSCMSRGRNTLRLMVSLVHPMCPLHGKLMFADLIVLSIAESWHPSS